MLYKKIFNLLLDGDVSTFMWLMLLSVVVAAIEAAGVALLMPFISISTDFSVVLNNEYYAFLYNEMGFTTASSFVVGVGVFLVVFYIFRSVINVYYIYRVSCYMQRKYHELSLALMDKYMGMTLSQFSNTNNSHLVKTIVTEASYLVNVLQMSLLMLSELFVVVFIYSMMLYMNSTVTVALSVFFFIMGYILVLVVSRKIKKEGENRERFQKDFYEEISSALGNFKFIKLLTNKNEVLSKISNVSVGYMKANITNTTLSNAPRFVIEAVGLSIVVISITLIVWHYDSNISEYLPIITVFVLGLYRLLPSLNRIMSSYNGILYNIRSVDIVYEDLNSFSEKEFSEKVTFDCSIELSGVSFGYDCNQSQLKEINLYIDKGQKVAFVGSSGCGKSTLVDIIMGLHSVKSGKIIMDGNEINESNILSYRKKFGYIPQDIYLFDGTVAENVAFGGGVVEHKIRSVVKSANILDFFEIKELGLDTKVGENGVMLSGGQKQRIAIARALYHDPDVLVLDEATSALDIETEEKIMDELYQMASNKTLIIIAHRKSTLTKCDKIYEISGGRINEASKN